MQIVIHILAGIFTCEASERQKVELYLCMKSEKANILHQETNKFACLTLEEFDLVDAVLPKDQ
jgi:hypothetical protein